MALKAVIVDDEQAIVDLVRYHLEKEGMLCFEASEVQEAPKTIQRGKQVQKATNGQICRHIQGRG